MDAARHALSAIGIAIAMAGCQDSIATPFPVGLEPFTDDGVVDGLEWPPDERLVSDAGNPDVIRVYGRATLAVSADLAFAAARDPEVMVATCSTTSHSAMIDNEPEFALSYLVHYFVDDIVNVEWDDQWRGGGALSGEPQFMIKHQKVQGSDFIQLSEGTVALIDHSGITEVRFVEHLDAVQASPADVLAGMQRNYVALQAAVHGRPLPPCP